MVEFLLFKEENTGPVHCNSCNSLVALELSILLQVPQADQSQAVQIQKKLEYSLRSWNLEYVHIKLWQGRIPIFTYYNAKNTEFKTN